MLKPGVPFPIFEARVNLLWSGCTFRHLISWNFTTVFYSTYCLPAHSLRLVMLFTIENAMWVWPVLTESQISIILKPQADWRPGGTGSNTQEESESACHTLVLILDGAACSQITICVLAVHSQSWPLPPSPVYPHGSPLLLLLGSLAFCWQITCWPLTFNNGVNTASGDT